MTTRVKIKSQQPRSDGASAHAVPAAPAGAIPPVPPMVWLMTALHIGFMICIVLAMTPYTYSLDDLKKLFYLFFGPLLMTLSLFTILRGQAPVPPRLVGLGLLGFGIILLVSLLAAAHRWIGWQEFMFDWSAAGFLLSAMIIASRQRTGEIFIRFLVLQLLLTNLIGFFLFDLFPSNPEWNAPVYHFNDWLYGYQPPQLDPSGLQSLFYTFSQDKSMIAMQSTILNRDFYAGFCLLFLPLALLLMLEPGRTRRPIAWRLIGMTAALLSIFCVVQCQSKGEYIFGTLSCLFFITVYYFVGEHTHLRGRTMAGLMGGVALLVGTILWMLWPVLMGRLKLLTTSVQSRSIIWRGSLNVFEQHPIFGGGPGSFRIYFSLNRAPNYFDHEISNVTLESHNYFLDLLCETGPLGLAFFLLMIGSLAFMALARIFRHPDSRLRTLILAALTGTFAMFGSNLSSPSCRWPVDSTAMWTMIGLTTGLVLQGEPAYREKLLALGKLRSPAAPGFALSPFAYWADRWRLPILRALIAVSVPLILAGGWMGYHYFRSQVHYLDGLRAMNSGNAMLDEGKSPEDVEMVLAQAIRNFNKSLEIDATNYQSLYKMGSVHTTLSNITWQKVNWLLRQERVDQKVIQNTVALMNYYARKAVETYETVNALWPNYAEIDYNFGMLYSRIAQLIRIEEGMGVQPDFTERTPEEWMALAIRHAELMHGMSIKAEVATLLGGLYLQVQKSAEATAVFRKASDDYPDNEKLLIDYYDAALNAKDFAAQGDALWKLWRLKPLDDAVLNQLLTLAHVHRLDDLLRRVLTTLEEADPIDPRIAQYRLLLAVRGDSLADALTQIERYLKSGGADPSIIDQVRQLAGRMGQLERFDRIVKQSGSPSAKPATAPAPPNQS